MNVRKTPIDSIRMVGIVDWNEEIGVYGIASTHGKLVGVCGRQFSRWR